MLLVKMHSDPRFYQIHDAIAGRFPALSSGLADKVNAKRQLDVFNEPRQNADQVRSHGSALLAYHQLKAARPPGCIRLVSVPHLPGPGPWGSLQN